MSEATHYEEFAAEYEAWGVYMTDDRPVPVRAEDLAVHLRLQGCALDRKVAALQAMATQTRPAVEVLGEDRFRANVAVEAFVEVAA